MIRPVSRSAEFLRQARLAAGLDLAELAGDLRLLNRRNGPWWRWDINRALRAIEAGKQRPTEDQLPTLVRVLGFDIDDYRRLVAAENREAA